MTSCLGKSLAFIQLQSVQNVRDLGGLLAAEDRVIKNNLFFRGSALSKITKADSKLLFGKQKISCIIDLRTGWERAEKPDQDITGVESLHIPFYDLEKVGIEYTEPAAGTKVVGRDVACDPEHFYRSLANPLTVNQIRKSMHILLENGIQGKGTYIHCSGGKDRVGILVVCLLLCLGVSKEEIERDYMLTNVAREKNIKEAFERFMRFTNDEEKAWEITRAHSARPQNLQAFYEAVESAYGNIGAFIENQLDVSCDFRKCAIDACTQEAHE